MPVAVHRGYDILVACPRKKKPVDVDFCYRCPFYIKRDGDFVYCKYEIAKEAGVRSVRVVSRDPVIVRSDAGEVFAVGYGNPRGELILKRIPT